MDNWLQGYAYRTELSVWMFAAVGVGALLITLSIVSIQTVKAVLGSPVKSELCVDRNQNKMNCLRIITS